MSSLVPTAQILLIEPQFVLRRTIVAVARDLGIAEFHEATSVDVALSKLAAKRFDGVVIAVDGSDGAFNLLSRLRLGSCASAAATHVIALTPGSNDPLDARLAHFEPVQTLRKPFKVADLLQGVQRWMTKAESPVLAGAV